MENINLLLTDQGYDELLELSRKSDCPQYGESIDIALKKEATQGKKPGVLISFTAMIDGKPRRVSAFTTASLFLNAARAVETASI